MVANTPATRKAKGRVFQQQIRDDISLVLGIDLVDVKSTGMGQAGCDIYLSAAAREVMPFGIECKAQDTLSIPAWLKQTKVNADKEKLLPLLLFKMSNFEKNRPGVYAVIEWDILLAILFELDCKVWSEILKIHGGKNVKVPKV
jgi:hypothetical protein